jgi:hypothetical protein
MARRLQFATEMMGTDTGLHPDQAWRQVGKPGVRYNVPLGVQLVAGRFREDLYLDAAEIIESRVGLLTPIDPTSSAHCTTASSREDKRTVGASRERRRA